MNTYQYNTLSHMLGFDIPPFCAPIYRPSPDEHKHDYFELTFVEKGQCKQIINNKQYTFKRNTCCIIRPNDSHYFILDKDNNLSYNHYDIYCTVSKFKEICDFLHPSLYTILTNNHNPLVLSISENLTSLLIQYTSIIINAQRKTDKNLNLVNALHRSVISMILTSHLTPSISIQKHPEQPIWFTNFLDSLNILDNMILSVSELAEKLHYDPSYLSRTFKKYKGETLKDYLTKKKVYYAVSILSSSPSLRIMDIALILNFDNPSNFTKQFQKIIGVSPSEYKNKKIE